MNNKTISIMMMGLDKETRHYICRRMAHPEVKNWPGPKQKKPDENAQAIGKPIKVKPKYKVN